MIKEIFEIPQTILCRKFNVPTVPRVFAYSVTWRCNCKCFMCGNYTKEISEELDLEDIKKIFNDKLLNNFHLVRFTGGEPFVKDNFSSIAEVIAKKSRAKILYVATNGYFTDRIVDFVKRLQPQRNFSLQIQISIDAVGNKHDEIRGLNGLFNNVYTTLEELKGLKNKYSFSVGISQTILSENLSQMKEVGKLAKQFGFFYYCNLGTHYHESRIMQIDTTQREVPFITISEFSKSEIKEICNNMLEINKETGNYKILSSPWLRYISEKYLFEGAINRLFQGKTFPPPNCFASFIYFRMHPEGSIVPCSVKSNRIIGNLREKSFTEIWKSNQAREIREEVNRCKGCWVECEVVPNFYYSGKIFIWILKSMLARKIFYH